MCHNNGGDRQYSCCVTPPVLVYDHLCSTIKSDSIQYMKTVKKEKKENQDTNELLCITASVPS